MAQNKESLKKNIITIVVVVIVSVSIRLFFNQDVSFDKELMKMASKMNETLPMMVDKGTRLDSSIAGPGNRIKYIYTLVNYTVDELDVDEVKKAFAPTIINGIKTSPDMKMFRDNDVIYSYMYRDKDGKFIFQLEVPPSMYK